MSLLPKISIVTITYCHEDYITNTLDGVLMQDYPGEIEFIIANDHSPDATDRVIKDYLAEKKIPTNITVKYTRHEKNKGMMPNFIWAIGESSGKYIALCEGDDYWVDPLKVKKQVQFLEQNHNYVLCFTNRNVLEKNELTISKLLHNKVSFNKTEIPRIYVPTLTAVFRNVVCEIPAGMHNSLIDCSLFLFLSQYGSFYYFNHVTAVYRVHSQGVYSGSSAILNYNRSVKARVVAWFYLKKIDKIALAHVITDWNRLKKETEMRERKYLSATASYILDCFFELYVLQRILQKKINKLIIKILNK